MKDAVQERWDTFTELQYQAVVLIIQVARKVDSYLSYTSEIKDVLEI